MSKNKKLTVKVQQYGITIVHYERSFTFTDKEVKEFRDANLSVDYMPQRELLDLKVFSDWISVMLKEPITAEEFIQEIQDVLLNTLGEVRFMITCSVSIPPSSYSLVVNNRMEF